MKKTVLTVALAAVLVLTLGSVALAKGASPANRSSAFLAKGESYISWDKAQAQMLVAGESADNTASVHGNYTITTVKCQVCHSAHKAGINGDTLLQSTAAQACVPCHLGATATTVKKVSAGNRHGETSQCTNGYCHTTSPHGTAGASKYSTLKSALLTNHADSLLDAAIASAGTGAPVKGHIFTTGATAFDALGNEVQASILATVAVYNPGVTAAIMNDMSSATSISFGRAVGTGYICNNGGCHINGAFNALTANASWGVWEGVVKVDAPGYASAEGTIPAGTYGPTATFVGTDGGTYNVWDEYHMRDEAIKGHTLKAVADLSVNNTAFANVGRCNTCHDGIDYRISSSTKQFPHGNTIVNPDGTTGGVSYAWFKVGSYLNSADTTMTLKASARTSGSDGACLKCHRGSATTGVGFDY